MKKNDKPIKPGYKMTSLGAIPDDWEVKRLKEICLKFLNGGTPSTDNTEFWGGSIPWITGADIVEGEITIRKKISESAVRKSATNVIPSDNLLIVTRTGVGKIARTNFPIAISQDLTGLIIDNKIVNLQYLFQTMNFSQSNLKKLNQGTSINGITRNVLQNISICLPPLPEQVTVAKVLSTWDEAIEKTTRLIEQKELRKKALMQQLLTGKKRLKGFSGEWKEEKLGTIGKTYTGLNGKSKEDFGEGDPYIPYLNIYNNYSVDTTQLDYVRIAKNEKQNRVIFGDILFTVSSETSDEVGMVSVLLNDVKELYLNSFCFGFRLQNFETLVPRFCAFFFRGEKFRKKIFKLSQGATRYNISKQAVMRLTVSIPDKDEQIAIAEILQKADDEIKLEKQKLEQFRLQKKALMQVLLMGKRRIKYE